MKLPLRICLPVAFTVCLSVMLPDCQAEEPASIAAALKHRVIETDLPWQEVQAFTETRILPMPQITSRVDWEAYIEGRRQAVFDDVIFIGEAKTWRDAETKVEWLGEIEGGEGYRIRKLRYEAIPGLWIPALLYEPLDLDGKVPVVLNVNGHDGNGKAADYKQIRCINQAKRGMLALNVEWMGMGQLRTPGFNHYKSNQIDLTGTAGIATHYLYMQRALDLLLKHPHADAERVAVAGLSGGGWQTIFISSLDQRVTLSNPVAGYSSYFTRVHHTSDLGDSEQTPVDLAMTADYTQLTAMRAPRPTLLTFNEQDQCCFAAPHAKEPLMAAAQPVFDLYGQSDALRAHVNHDPGTHNFLLDNRQQLYRMLGDFFFAGDPSYSSEEIPADGEVKTAEQLHVELPQENLDFHQIAVNLMAHLPDPRNTIRPARQQRTRLRELLRFDAARAEAVQQVEWKTESEQWTAATVRLRVGSEWTVPGTLFVPTGEVNGTVVLIADGGRGTQAMQVQQQLQQGKRVLAVDLFYFGESKISQRDFLYALLVSSVGKRPLGIQAAQLLAISRWCAEEFADGLEIVARGRRNGLVALVAVALDPQVAQRVSIADGFSSLKQVIDQDIAVNEAPELFTFGLLQEFDIPQLQQLARPCPVESVEN